MTGIPSSLRDENIFPIQSQPLRSWLISFAASRLCAFALKCFRRDVAPEVRAVEMNFFNSGVGEGLRGFQIFS